MLMKDSYSEDPALTQKTVTQGRLIAEGTNADFCPDPERLDYLEDEKRRQANWYKQFDYKHKRKRK
jgi:hypothetical protein